MGNLYAATPGQSLGFARIYIICIYTVYNIIYKYKYKFWTLWMPMFYQMVEEWHIGQYRIIFVVKKKGSRLGANFPRFRAGATGFLHLSWRMPPGFHALVSYLILIPEVQGIKIQQSCIPSFIWLVHGWRKPWFRVTRKYIMFPISCGDSFQLPGKGLAQQKKRMQQSRLNKISNDIDT